MEIKIGKLRMSLSALALYKHGDNPELSNYIAAREAPKTLYNWNCQTGLGDRPRGAVFRQETIIKFLVTNDKGRADDLQSGFLRDEAVKASDLASIQAFDRELQKQLPPLEVRVDWAKLWQPFKDAHSLRIMYEVKFLKCVARPFGMDIQDYFYILAPLQVTFKTIIKDPSCGGTLAKDSTAETVSAKPPLNQQPLAIAQLEKQINAEEREAEEARRRENIEMMMELGLPFTHEGGVLEEEEQEEENGVPHKPEDD